MATFNVTLSKHSTLVANVVDIVNISGTHARVRVTNRGATAIFVRADGIDPTFGGDNTLGLLPNTEKLVTVPDINNISIKIFSTGAIAYSVEAE